MRWHRALPAWSQNSRNHLDNSGPQKPLGGTTRLPMEAAGGGPIYPEQELQVGDVLVMYARNQKPELVKTVVEDMPEVKEQVLNWFPSAQGGKTMNLILSAGGGGGWAVNAYKPEEVGIISLDKEGILSVFAHELTDAGQECSLAG